MEKIFYHHTKEYVKNDKGELILDANGRKQIDTTKSRITYAGIFENNELKIAAARCSPKDQFCKAVGRAKAFGRAKAKCCPYREDLPKPAEGVELREVGRRFMEIIKSNIIRVN